MAGFSSTGGARIDGFNATFPLATLTGDSDALHLSCLGREYHFPRSSIRCLRRYRGLFSVGLQIEHTEEALPEFIVFWASAIFWNSGFETLRRQLEELGYEVML